MARIVEVPLDEIKDPSVDLRSMASEEGIEELAKSVRQLGVLEPVIVKPVPDGFEVIAGWRRTAAARLAGLVTIPCRIMAKKPEYEDEIRVHENLYREDISDVDYARFFRYLRYEKQWSMDKIALAIGKSVEFVRQRLSVLAGDERVLAALEAEKINFSVARELVTVESSSDRARFLKFAVENGATEKTIRSWKRSAHVSETVLSATGGPVETPKLEEEEINYEDLMEPCFICGHRHIPSEMTRVYICGDCHDEITRQKHG